MSHLGKTGSWFLILLFLSACSANGPVNIKGEAITDFYPAFTKGELRLKCGASCAGAWGSTRAEAKRYYDNGLWQDLVYAISRVGHENDLSYFYLGSAASKLGYPEAARVYFRLARAARLKCAGFLNHCDGFDIPALLDQIQPKTPQVIVSTPADKTLTKFLTDQGKIVGYIQNPKPIYPEDSRLEGEEGRVLVKATINPDGSCQSVVVHESSGYPRLDDAAVSAVKHWKFVPFTKNDQPITSNIVIIPFGFSLQND